MIIRPAVSRDLQALQKLIRRSAEGLSAGYYDAAQIAAATTYIFGVDTQIIGDRTYYVAESEGEIVGCGGWSRRGTLFGGDQWEGREEHVLDPATDAARIRAFSVSPVFKQCGIARLLLERCEADAASAGFTRLTLMATLPGLPFYQAMGFRAEGQVEHDAGGISVPFVHMTKRPDPISSNCRARSD